MDSFLQALTRDLAPPIGSSEKCDLVARLNEMDTLSITVDRLQYEMQLGFAKLEGALEAGLAKADARLENGLRSQMRFFFFAWAVQLAAVIGLYAR